MRLILFADNVVGLRIAKYLLDNYRSDLTLIVTTGKNDIFDAAEAAGIPVCIFDSAQAVMARVSGDVDLGVLAWWPKILRRPLLEFPRDGFVNTHPSLLPYNRGKHYNFWALVERAPFGVTLHHVDAGIDTGDVIAQQEIPYGWCDTGGSLYTKAQTAMVELFRETYPLLRTRNYKVVPQLKTAGSFHHSSELEPASQINLDGMYRGRDILNLLRARTFDGFPGCWFQEDENRYEISIKIRKVD